MKILLNTIPMHRRFGEKGFTLIELLIVIAILGILAAVAIPNVANFIHGSTISAANTELGAVQTANGAYAAAHNSSFATNSSQLTGYLDPAIKGSYTMAADSGHVTAASYPGVLWNNEKFY